MTLTSNSCHPCPLIHNKCYVLHYNIAVTLEIMCTIYYIIIIIIVRLASFQCIAPPITSRVVCPVPPQWHLPWWDCGMTDRSSLWAARRYEEVQSLWRTAVRILLASADSSTLAKWPNIIRCLFWIIKVTSGYSDIRCTSQLGTCRYQRMLRILLHCSSTSILLASVFDRAQHWSVQHCQQAAGVTLQLQHYFYPETVQGETYNANDSAVTSGSQWPASIDWTPTS